MSHIMIGSFPYPELSEPWNGKIDSPFLYPLDRWNPDISSFNGLPHLGYDRWMNNTIRWMKQCRISHHELFFIIGTTIKGCGIIIAAIERMFFNPMFRGCLQEGVVVW